MKGPAFSHRISTRGVESGVRLCLVDLFDSGFAAHLMNINIGSRLSFIHYSRAYIYIVLRQLKLMSERVACCGRSLLLIVYAAAVLSVVTIPLRVV